MNKVMKKGKGKKAIVKDKMPKFLMKELTPDQKKLGNKYLNSLAKFVRNSF